MGKTSNTSARSSVGKDSTQSKRELRKKEASQAYTETKRLVILRDNWRCRHCGNSANLEVHHIVKRSHKLRTSDEPWNLITLCHSCHGLIERNRLVICQSGSSDSTPRVDASCEVEFVIPERPGHGYI